MTFYDLIRYFITYAFLGWCIEVGYAAFKKGKFVNRGFLNGPVCPVYGFGMLIVLVFLLRLKDNFVVLFVGSVVLTSALEYLTGFALEKVFNDKWWDYSECKYNIKGYICLKFSLAWGVACIFAVRVIHPLADKVLNFIPFALSVVILCILYAALTTDAVLTIAEMLRIKKYFKNADRLEKHLRVISDTVGEEITDTVLKAEKIYENLSEKRKNGEVMLEEYKINLKKNVEAWNVYIKMKTYADKKGYMYNRLANAFPNYFEKNISRIKKIKSRIKNQNNE